MSESQPLPGMMVAPKLAPGDRVRVAQRIVAHDRTYVQYAEGTVLSCGPETTGSWFAHGKHDKLWLLRLRLQKDDGEISALVVDQNTTIEKM